MVLALRLLALTLIALLCAAGVVTALHVDADGQSYFMPQRVPNRTLPSRFPATGTASSRVTLIIQGTVDRIEPRLLRVASQWGCSTSVAVYVDQPEGSPGAEAQLGRLAALHQSLLSYRLTSVDISVMFSNAESDGTTALRQLFDTCTATSPCNIQDLKPPMEASYSHQYPQNALRNLAADQARTPLLLQLDIDFLLSHGACANLEGRGAGGVDAAITAALRRQDSGGGSLLVVPVFQMGPEVPFPADKMQLVGMLGSEQITVFKARSYKMGHMATKYVKWMDAEEAYPVQHQVGYEPFYVASARHTPRYEDRLRGYGKDRTLHLWEAIQTGAELQVLPEVFAIHIDHPPSSDRALFDSAIHAYDPATALHFHDYKIIKWFTYWVEEELALDALARLGRTDVESIPHYKEATHPHGQPAIPHPGVPIA